MNNPIARAVAWITLGVACVILGATLTAAAAAFGLTNFIGDYRGEWHLVVAPVSLAILLAIGIPAFLYLRRAAPVRRLIIFSTAVVLVTFCFYTWRFMSFAA